MLTFAHVGLPIGRAKGYKSDTTILTHKHLPLFIFVHKIP